MDADFLDAHKRHWEDAELLKNQKRLANADHLYGIAAECGLKRLMIAFGMRVDDEGTPSSQDKKHANAIWQRYESYRSRHPEGAAYALPSENPFSNWDVSQRYANQSNFTQSDVEAHRQGAESVRFLIDQAKEGGLI